MKRIISYLYRRTRYVPVNRVRQTINCAIATPLALQVLGRGRTSAHCRLPSTRTTDAAGILGYALCQARCLRALSCPVLRLHFTRFLSPRNWSTPYPVHNTRRIKLLSTNLFLPCPICIVTWHVGWNDTSGEQAYCYSVFGGLQAGKSAEMVLRRYHLELMHV